MTAFVAVTLYIPSCVDHLLKRYMMCSDVCFYRLTVHHSFYLDIFSLTLSFFYSAVIKSLSTYGFDFLDRIGFHSGPIRGRMTDTDGSGEFPHPSSGPDGIGGPTTPSVILIRYGWVLYQKKQKKYPSVRMV